MILLISVIEILIFCEIIQLIITFKAVLLLITCIVIMSILLIRSSIASRFILIYSRSSILTARFWWGLTRLIWSALMLLPGSSAMSSLVIFMSHIFKKTGEEVFIDLVLHIAEVSFLDMLVGTVVDFRWDLKDWFRMPFCSSRGGANA